MNSILKLLAALLAGLFLFAPIAAADELVFRNVELEDDEVAPGATLEVQFDLQNPSNKDYRDVVVTAQVKGDADTKVTKDFGTVAAGTTREERTVTVNVPEDLRDGSYKVVLTAKGKLSGVGTKTTTLEVPFTVEQEDYSAFIDEVELSDEELLAGTSVDVAVKVMNNGVNDLEDLKITVELIAELKARQSIVLRELAQDNEETVYLTLNVPQGAESGIYTLKTTVSNARVNAVSTQNVQVTKIAAPVQTDSGIVTPTVVQTPSIKLGQGAVVSLEVTNNQDSRQTYDVVLGGVADWTSSARVDPATVTLDSDESATVQVYLLPKTAGERAFTLYVKDGATLVSATQVNVKVQGSAVPTSVAGQQFDKSWAVAAAIVVLGVLGAMWSYRNRGNGQKKLGQGYY